MSENLHDIDKLFQESIEGHAETPPPGVWEQLDKKLDQKKVASIAGRYRMLKWVAAALFLISVGMAMWVYHLQTIKKKGELVKKTDRRIAPGSERVTQDQQGSTGKQEPAPFKQADKEDTVQRHAATSPLPSGMEDEAVVKKKSGTEDIVTRTQKANTEKIRQQSIPKNSAPLTIGKNGLQMEVAKQINKKNTREKSYIGEVHIGSTHDLITAQTQKTEAQQGLEEEKLLVAAIGEPVPHAGSNGIDFSRLPQLRLRSLMPDLIFSSPAAPVKLTSPHGGFTATVFFSPNMVSNTVTNDERIKRGHEDDKDTIKDKEQNGSSRSIGALINYNFNQHWSLGSGLILSSRTTQIDAKPIIAGTDPRGGEIRYRFNCSSGYSYIDVKLNGSNPIKKGDTANAVYSKNILKYLSVPVVLTYALGDGKFRFVTSAGLQANFLTMSKIETFVSKGSMHDYATTSDIQGLRSVYFSGIVSAGATYKLNRIVTASVVPTAQLGFMSISEHNPVKSYVNFYGLALGLSIKL